jgi:hypothetical protein
MRERRHSRWLVATTGVEEKYRAVLDGKPAISIRRMAGIGGACFIRAQED